MAKKKIAKRKRMPKNKVKKKTKILCAKNLPSHKALARRRTKSKIKESTPDIIFDSKIGNTDALFVSVPQPVRHVAPAIPPAIDPAIEQALKEFDALQEKQAETQADNSVAVPETAPDEDFAQPLPKDSVSEQTKPAGKGKSFWKKIFSFKNHFFSILVGLILAGVFCAGAYVFANPPTSAYTPPAPLEPGCGPTDPHCTVNAPLTDNFATDFSGTGNFTTTNTIKGGTLEVGTAYTFPTATGNANQVLAMPAEGTQLTWADAGGGIPYTGANATVDLGSQQLQTLGQANFGSIVNSGRLLFEDDTGIIDGLTLTGNGVSIYPIARQLIGSETYSSPLALDWSTGRVLIGGATDDTTSALQVKGSVDITGQYLVDGNPISGGLSGISVDGSGDLTNGTWTINPFGGFSGHAYSAGLADAASRIVYGSSDLSFDNFGALSNGTWTINANGTTSGITAGGSSDWSADSNGNIWSSGISAASSANLAGGNNFIGGYQAGANMGGGGGYATDNVVLGYTAGIAAGQVNGNASHDIFIGNSAGGNSGYNGNSSYSIFLGYHAGYNAGFGIGGSPVVSNDLFLGNYAGTALTNVSNTLIIDGADRSGADATTALIYGTFDSSYDYIWNPGKNAYDGTTGNQQLAINGNLTVNGKVSMGDSLSFAGDVKIKTPNLTNYGGTGNILMGQNVVNYGDTNVTIGNFNRAYITASAVVGYENYVYGQGTSVYGQANQVDGGLYDQYKFNFTCTAGDTNLYITGDKTPYFYPNMDPVVIRTTAPSSKYDTSHEAINVAYNAGTGKTVITLNSAIDSTTTAGEIIDNGGPQSLNTVMGNSNILNGIGYSNVFGVNNNSYQLGSSVDTLQNIFGYGNQISGTNTMIFGNNNVVNGNNSIVIGNGFDLEVGDTMQLGTNATTNYMTLAGGNLTIPGTLIPNGGVDVAENYPTKDATLSAGEIVALDITNPVFVVRANSLNSSAILGIISTAPGMKMGSEKKYADETKVPVALAGRVPVKVTGEGGAINIGDRIALSTTTAGFGMRALAGENTVGIALEPFSGTDATATGTILIFVQNQQNNLNSSGTIGSGTVAGVSGQTFLQSVKDSLAGLGIAIENGIVKISSLAVDSLNVKTAQIQEIQMVATNGDIYCTWIDANGDWQKIKGDCATVGPTVSTVVAPESSTTLTNPTTTEASPTTSVQAQVQINAARQAA